MSGPRPADLLRQLATDVVSDRDLLRRFTATRDGDAFAELVRRHGPVVLAASRRGVGNYHDADDVFQAVFLILARKAGSIRPPELLGNWLYGVAVGVARNARRAAARRRVREVQGVDAPEPVAPPTTVRHDLGPVLDEELNALPALYRDAVVLCDLRGVSRADAAAQLGIPLGTLASRLDAGRKKLAARLVRRGVTLSVGAVLVEARAVAVPEGLLSKTCEVVAVWSAGGVLPQSVVNLVQGGFAMRRTLFLGLVAAVVTTVVGIGLAALPEPHTQPAPPAAPAVADRKVEAAPAALQPQAEADKTPVRLGTPVLSQKVDLPLKDARELAWSPDGKLLAVSGPRPGRPVPADAFPAEEATSLYVLPVADRKLQAGVATLPDDGRVVGFSADGANVLTVVAEPGLISGSTALQLWTVAVDTPGGVRANLIRVQKGPAFDLPDRATGLVATEPGVLFVVPENGTADIARAEVHGLDTRDGRRAGPAARLPLAAAFPFAGPAAGLTGTLQAIALSPNGARCATMTTTGVVEGYGPDWKRAWKADLSPADPGARNFGFGFNYLTYARGGAVLLAARPLRRPAAFDAGTGKPLPAFEGAEPLRDNTPRWGTALSADGRLAAVAYTPTATGKGTVGLPIGLTPQPPRLTVWDTTTGRVVRTWYGRTSEVALAFHPTRPVLAVLEPNGDRTRLGLWDFSAQP